MELHARIDAARRRCPETDPLTAEAMALREYRAGLAAGTISPAGVSPEWVTTVGGEDVEIPAEDVALEHV